MPPKNITVISSFARDTIVDASGKKQELLGGPALFITDALEKTDFQYQLITPPQPFTVEIQVDARGEHGRIVNQPPVTIIDLAKHTEAPVLISTILQEFEFINKSNGARWLYIDAQGFVRDGRFSGGKKRWQPPSNMTNTIACLKATDQESKYIDPAILQHLKERAIVIITNGSQGSVLYNLGSISRLVPKMKADTKNTVGAGDTLLALFTAEHIRSNNVELSLKRATDGVTDFLINK